MILETLPIFQLTTLILFAPQSESLPSFLIPLSPFLLSCRSVVGIFTRDESMRHLSSTTVALFSNILTFSSRISTIAGTCSAFLTIPTPLFVHHRGVRAFQSFKNQHQSTNEASAVVEMFHFPSIHSTQDQMKSILKDPSKHKPNSFVAITASEQTQGRGTNGRSWIGHLGNVFLTIAIPASELDIIPSLLPLQIGTIVTERIYKLLKNAGGDTLEKHKLTIKWPNDVLLNEHKVAGILIESDQDYENHYYFLVGIGINYKFAPEIDSVGVHRGRTATCICDCIDCGNTDGIEEAKELGIHIAHDIKDWVSAQKGWDGAAEAIVQNWERWAEFGQTLVLRDDPADTLVIPIGIEKDGRLRVKGVDGKERLLCFDYLL